MEEILIDKNLIYLIISEREKYIFFKWVNTQKIR